MKNPPPTPPTQRELARMLRAQHEYCAHPDCGGEFFGLRLVHPTESSPGWILSCEFGREYGWTIYGREYIPGDGVPFDAVACARRLLSAVRDAK